MTAILLASSSQYRRQLIEKLGISVDFDKPEIDETPLPQEFPEDLAKRLSMSKAEALRETYPNHFIIGSDQVAELEGELLGKPGNHSSATRQLQTARGKIMHFHTGIALLNASTGKIQYRCSRYQVKFRQLTDAQIDSYLKKETPYDCAGSFKSEGLGIALFEYIRGDDPNSLVGLPLIQLTDMLSNEGIDVLTGSNL